MSQRSETVKTAGAFVVGLAGFGLAPLIIDSTPLLVEPRPDLDWPLGLLGVVAGFWAAHRVTRLPYVAARRVGRVAVWIMFPLWLCFGLSSLGSRIQEMLSFRQGAVARNLTMRVAHTERVTGRRGGVSYEVTVINPFERGQVTLRVDEATFATITPEPGCVIVGIERASNGAVRLIAPRRWNMVCP